MKIHGRVYNISKIENFEPNKKIYLQRPSKIDQVSMVMDHTVSSFNSRKPLGQARDEDDSVGQLKVIFFSVIRIPLIFYINSCSCFL